MISPMVSFMQDQLANLEAPNASAAAIIAKKDADIFLLKEVCLLVYFDFVGNVER